MRKDKHLPGVGVRVVTETFVDHLRSDENSFRAQARQREPTLPSLTADDFMKAKLLASAQTCQS